MARSKQEQALKPKEARSIINVVLIHNCSLFGSSYSWILQSSYTEDIWLVLGRPPQTFKSLDFVMEMEQ